MKIFIATQEEPFYLPRFFANLLPRLSRHEIVGVNILPPFNSQHGWRDVLRDYWGFYGAAEFFRHGLLFAWRKAGAALRFDKLDGRPRSVARVFADRGVPIHRILRQNTDAFRALLAVDALLSVADPVVLKKQTLATPARGCLNFHAGALPRYRGINPSFWALLNGEKQSAVTVHLMDEKLDNGPILGQTVIPFDDGETFDSLLGKVVARGPELVAATLDGLAAGTVAPRPNDAAQATYFGFPSAADGKRFRAKGLRFR
jgi:hypothetical protein